MRRRTEVAVTWKCGGRVEHAVDDDTVEVPMGIERLPEAVDKGDRAEARRQARATCAQAGLHGAQSIFTPSA